MLDGIPSSGDFMQLTAISTYQRAHFHPFTHAAIDGCGYCEATLKDRQAIITALPALIRVHALWLQYHRRSSTEVQRHLQPAACCFAYTEWLGAAIGDALWAAGYTPDCNLSPDPSWTWGGHLDELD